MTSPHNSSIDTILNDLVPGSFDVLEKIDQFDDQGGRHVLGAILARACGSAKVYAIVEGRKAFGRLPKTWLEKHLEDAISGSVDFSDYWEYGRLLELLGEHFPKLLERYSKMGLNSEDEDIRSAAKLGMRQLKEEYGDISPESSHTTNTDR